MGKKIIIAGGTGFIGQALSERLAANENQIVLLSRSGKGESHPDSQNILVDKWDAKSGDGWAEKYDGADAIVNLAGQNIASGLWTRSQKQRILQSRISAGQAITDGVNRMTQKPKLIIQASGVGYYGFSQTEQFDESSVNGDGFLASVAKQWESAIDNVNVQVPIAIFRIGLVVSRDAVMVKLAKLQNAFFIGGHLGSGKQWMSWIHRDDLISVFEFILDNNASGIYNVCSPKPVRGHDFFKALANAMNRPSWFHAPAFVLKFLAGQMANELILNGQHVIPANLLKRGFTFQYDSIDKAMTEMLR